MTHPLHTLTKSVTSRSVFSAALNRKGLFYRLNAPLVTVSQVQLESSHDMFSQQSYSQSQTSLPSSSIRRIHSAPRLFKRTQSYRRSDSSALVTSPLSTPDSSSGDETVAVKPRNKAQFECNICLDAARDPVVTQCGHLYCWPCLHRVAPSFLYANL